MRAMTEVDPKIIEAKRKAEEGLLKLPGVTGVDIGFKEVGGKPTDKLAIRVLVSKKRKDVPKEERVPDEIDGIPTDVIERKFELHQVRARMRVEDLAPMVDAGTYTPLKGGISIGPCRAVGGYVFAGTLGAIVTDNASGKHMMLSNFHVMCIDTTYAVGNTMTQPSRVDGSSCPGGVVGTLARQSLGGKVDCAVADITGTRGTTCEIVDIGLVAGQAVPILGQKVRKRGRTTTLTYGVVDSIHLTVTINYGAGIGNITLTDQIGVKPDTAHNAKFGDHGDSGSVVVDDGRKVVGLYFAGDPTGYGVANPIAAVLAALNVSLCVGGIKIKELKDLKAEIKEHKDVKVEIKELKLEKVEHKDVKAEIKELKDAKVEKPEVKDHKELKFEKIEHKEISKLEHGEKPGFKEKDGKELKESGFEGPGGPHGPGDPGPIFGQRLAALEQAVTSLGHFISAGLRPDLSRGALISEPDLAAQSAALAAQAKTAKDAKDAKDTEKLGDR
jgi:hypothetical protein